MFGPTTIVYICTQDTQVMQGKNLNDISDTDDQR